MDKFGIRTVGKIANREIWNQHCCLRDLEHGKVQLSGDFWKDKKAVYWKNLDEGKGRKKKKKGKCHLVGNLKQWKMQHN